MFYNYTNNENVTLLVKKRTNWQDTFKGYRINDVKGETYRSDLNDEYK